MVKCPLCDKEYKDGRALHAHMLKAHLSEYRAAGCKLSAFGVDARFSATRKKPAAASFSDPDPAGRPVGLRMLRASDPVEAVARSRGYRFIDEDSESIYTLDEVKRRGWI